MRRRRLTGCFDNAIVHSLKKNEHLRAHPSHGAASERHAADHRDQLGVEIAKREVVFAETVMQSHGQGQGTGFTVTAEARSLGVHSLFEVECDGPGPIIVSLLPGCDLDGAGQKRLHTLVDLDAPLVVLNDMIGELETHLDDVQLGGADGADGTAKQRGVEVLAALSHDVRHPDGPLVEKGNSGIQEGADALGGLRAVWPNVPCGWRAGPVVWISRVPAGQRGSRGSHERLSSAYGVLQRREDEADPLLKGCRSGGKGRASRQEGVHAGVDADASFPWRSLRHIDRIEAYLEHIELVAVFEHRNVIITGVAVPSHMSPHMHHRRPRTVVCGYFTPQNHIDQLALRGRVPLVMLGIWVGVPIVRNTRIPADDGRVGGGGVRRLHMIGSLCAAAVPRLNMWRCRMRGCEMNPRV